MIKHPPANAGDTSSIPGSGRPPEKEIATHSSILAWERPRTEEAGGYSPWGRKVSDTNQQLKQRQEPHIKN